MKVVTQEEMLSIEKAADAGGLMFSEMMQRAGEAAAREALAIAPSDASVLVICGPGNNGGDGLVAARALCEAGRRVDAIIWGHDADPLLKEATDAGAGITWLPNDEPFSESGAAALRTWLEHGPDVVMDALFGTGLSRPIEGAPAELLGLLHSFLDETGPGERPFHVIALDVPSGLMADTGQLDPLTIPADVTIAFGFPKVGHLFMPGAASIGRLVVDPIGIPATLADSCTLEMITGDMVAANLPQRSVTGHKGSFGNVLVVGGSERYTGAPGLSAEGAYRAGAGLVTLAIPRTIHTALASRLPEAIFLPLADDDGAVAPSASAVVKNASKRADVVVLGPGITTGHGAAEVLDAVLDGLGELREDSAARVDSEDKRQPALVVDADGLSLLAAEPTRLRRLPASTVLTPHPGEMARLVAAAPAERWSGDVSLAGIDRLHAVRAHAAAWGHVIVLKGANTVIADPDGKTAVIPFATSALATAGTGDVLTGIIAGLLAGGAAPFQAAWCGAWIHALSGMLVRNRIGPRAAMARDVLDSISRALSAVERRGDRSAG